MFIRILAIVLPFVFPHLQFDVFERERMGRLMAIKFKTLSPSHTLI